MHFYPTKFGCRKAKIYKEHIKGICSQSCIFLTKDTSYELRVGGYKGAFSGGQAPL